MKQSLRASLLILAIVLTGFHAFAATHDVSELVGDVLLDHVWRDDGAYPRVQIGNERALSAYGGVERFILGTKGVWLERWHESKFFPIEQVTWIELRDPYALNMDEVVDGLRQGADWYEKLPEIGDWYRLNFTYAFDRGNRTTTMAASEAMLSNDYLVIVDSDRSNAILLNRSIVKHIEWPSGEMEVTAKAPVSAPVPQGTTGAGSITVSVAGVGVAQWSGWVASVLPKGHPAHPIEEPALVITLRIEPLAGTLEGVVWGQGQIGDIFSRRFAIRTPAGYPGARELEMQFIGVESLVDQQSFTLTYQLTLPGASVPTTYTFELEVPDELKKAQFPYIPKPRSMADLFTHEAGVLEQFLSDVRAKNGTHLRAWLEYSDLDHVYELLMSETMDITSVVDTPVSGGDQLAAIVRGYDAAAQKSREFAVFFRYSNIGWRLYGFYEKVPADEGTHSGNG